MKKVVRFYVFPNQSRINEPFSQLSGGRGGGAKGQKGCFFRISQLIMAKMLDKVPTRLKKALVCPIDIPFYSTR